VNKVNNKNDHGNEDRDGDVGGQAVVA